MNVLLLCVLDKNEYIAVCVVDENECIAACVIDKNECIAVCVVDKNECIAAYVVDNLPVLQQLIFVNVIIGYLYLIRHCVIFLVRSGTVSWLLSPKLVTWPVLSKWTSDVLQPLAK